MFLSFSSVLPLSFRYFVPFLLFFSPVFFGFWRSQGPKNLYNCWFLHDLVNFIQLRQDKSHQYTRSKNWYFVLFLSFSSVLPLSFRYFVPFLLFFSPVFFLVFGGRRAPKTYIQLLVFARSRKFHTITTRKIILISNQRNGILCFCWFFSSVLPLSFQHFTKFQKSKISCPCLKPGIGKTNLVKHYWFY